ncbi:MAG: hypothetical protein OEZ06_08850 [Myxococcales bacterium]|nr:hypothetical protein [Myxococcales bacterium]
MFGPQHTRPNPLALILAMLLACAAATVASVPTTAQAAPPEVKGEVLVILAEEKPGAIDDKLRAIKALQKAPFNSFKSMKVLSTNAVSLGENRTATVDLPNGRRLQLELVERLSDGRHKVKVSINRPSKKDYLPLLTVIASGEPFFVAGQKFQNGTLVIGVKIELSGKGDKK